MLEIFDDGDQQDLLDEFGTECLIYSSTQCSCIFENNGRFDNKDDCYFGYRFKEPVSQILIRTNYRMGEENINLGALFQGGARFSIFKNQLDGTPNPFYKTLARGDVIVNLSDTIRKTDFLNYKKRDHLWAFNVIEVQSISSRSKIFKPDIDYKIEIAENQNDKTNIIWQPKGETPEDVYAVEYISNVNYWVYSDLPKSRGASNDSVPKSVSCILRAYGEKEMSNLLNVLDFTSKPDDNVNI